MKKKEFKRIEKLMFFPLELLAQAVEMKKLQIKHQKAKNEELRLKQSTPTAELRQYEFGGFPNGQNEEVVLKKDEPIDEKLKDEVENDPMFKLAEEIFNPQKNKERLDQIVESLNLPKGAIAVKVVKREKDDVCGCPACQLRRQIEKGENGLN